ncbi:MAG: efflux RND transporter periplasmic adaptor subunit [Steroidobacteraceae bacterium]
MDRPRVLPWWRRDRWHLWGAVALMTLLILAAALLLGPAQRSVRLPTSGLIIGTVERGIYHDIIPLTGEVVPHDTVDVDSGEGGRIERILVQAGDRVTATQPLVELSNTALELDVLDREGRLVQSVTESQAYATQLEQNRVANEKALAQIDYDIVRLRRALARREGLVAQHLVSVESRDEIKDELDHDLIERPMQQESNEHQEALRRRQLPEIQAQIAKLQQDLVVTHNKLHELTVRAPVTGLLTTLDLTVGQNLNRGDRLAEVTPETGYKLSASIDEYYLTRLHTGQSGRIDLNEQPWALKVTRVYPQVKDGSFKVDLAFDGPTPPGLLRGQTLQGRLSLGADHVGLVLPAGAFLERSGGDWGVRARCRGPQRAPPAHQNRPTQCRTGGSPRRSRTGRARHHF